MDLNSTTESGELPKKPLSQMRYNILVFFGVLVNSSLMILSVYLCRPSYFNAQGSSLFLISIYLIIPTLGSLVYSLFVSIVIPRKYTVSPAYVVSFSIVPAYLLGAYVTYEIYSLQTESIRISAIMSHLITTSLLYFFWIGASIVVMQPIVRGLVGAYAERENVKSGTLSYKTSIPLNNLLEKIEDSKWLSDFCSMRIIDRKEKDNVLQIRFCKFETRFYLALYAKRTDSETLISLTPYELDENLAKKIIRISDDSKSCLQPQIEEFEEEFQLEHISTEDLGILYESINYAMSPARFPAIVSYGKQISVAAAVLIGSLLIAISFLTGAIPEVQTAISIIAILVAVGSTTITILSRR